MTRNSTTVWGWPAILLHWIGAVLILVLLVHGAWMVHFAPRPERAVNYAWHAALGYDFLALLVLRLLWRWINPVPALPGEPCDRQERSEPACRGSAFPRARPPAGPRFTSGSTARCTPGRSSGHADLSFRARGRARLHALCPVYSKSIAARIGLSRRREPHALPASACRAREPNARRRATSATGSPFP